jgi:hypothetical protein
MFRCLFLQLLCCDHRRRTALRSRHTIAALSQRCNRIPGRKVEQSSECKGSARIRS